MPANKKRNKVHPYFITSTFDGKYADGGDLEYYLAGGEMDPNQWMQSTGNAGNVNPTNMGFSAAAHLGSAVIDATADEQTDRVNVGAATGKSALQMGATGAQIGSTFGPIGTLIGGGVGLIGGAVLGHKKAKDAEEANFKALKNKYYGAYGGKLPELYAEGGPMGDINASVGEVRYNEFNGPSHENGGIPVGPKAEVEGGEVRVEDYIFSDRLQYRDSSLTYADKAKRIRGKYKDRETDEIAQKSMMTELKRLMAENESARITKEQEDQQNLANDIMAYGGYIKKHAEGGFLVDPENRSEVTKGAKLRNMKTQEFIDNLASNMDDEFELIGEPEDDDKKKKKKSKKGKKESLNKGEIKGGEVYYLDEDEYTDKEKKKIERKQKRKNKIAEFFSGGKKKKVRAEGFAMGGDLRELYNHGGPHGTPGESTVTSRTIDVDPYEGMGYKDYLGNHPMFYGALQEDGSPMPFEWWAEDNPNLAGGEGVQDKYKRLQNLYEATDESDINAQRGSFDGRIPETKTGAAADDILAQATKAGEDVAGQGQEGSKFKLGSEEQALIASSLPAMGNIIRGMSPAQTEFDRVDPEKMDLSKQRELAERKAAIAREVARENVRGSGRSSGEVLSNLAVQNAALTESQMQSDLQSFLQEETANTRISNQADRVNTQISMQETIANEQNRAMAESLQGMGLTDLSQAAQGYIKDKKMTAENQKYNARVMNMINEMFPNYQWGVDPENDQRLMLEFKSALGEE